MLIRVNEKNWIRADEIERIEISAANQIGNPEIAFAVNVITDGNFFSQLFRTFADAEKFASRLAVKINDKEGY